jgi:hypothetical protein
MMLTSAAMIRYFITHQRQYRTVRPAHGGAASDPMRGVVAAIPSSVDQDFRAAGLDHAQPLPGCA